MLKLMNSRKNANLMFIAAALAVTAGTAVAATTGTEFNGLVTMLRGWAEGGLGLALAMAAFLIGLAVGLMKQTVMPAVVGIGVALFATLGPGIIASMFTAII